MDSVVTERRADFCARLKAERYKPLVAVNAVSKQEYDDAVAAAGQANADVASARAAVRTAQINLGYTTVTAPISGRAGRALVTEGALVGKGEATKLALVEQVDPMWVTFTQPASEVTRLRRAIESGVVKGVNGGANVHLSIGKRSFDERRLLENYAAVVEEIVRAKPSAAKGRYIRSITVTTTMGPGIKLEIQLTLALAAA